MQKRNLVFSVLIACLAWSLASPSPAQNDRTHWFSNYEDAIREAKKTQKPVFLEFRCEP